jgi:hypothetical protein
MIFAKKLIFDLICTWVSFVLNQGILTEGEGSVLMTSSLRPLILYQQYIFFSM